MSSEPAPKEGRIQISRWKIGVITIGCFVGAGVVWFFWPDQEMAFASFIRVGVLMAALWLAMPGGGRPAAWANISKTTLIGGLAVVLAIARPAFRPMLPVVLGFLWVLNVLLKPSAKQRPSSRPDR